MRYFSCLILLVSLIILILGCDSDSESLETELKVIVAPRGGEIASNATITVIFSRPVASASIMINGSEVSATSFDNRVFTFHPGVEGELIVTIEAEGGDGEALEGFVPVTYRASHA